MTTPSRLLDTIPCDDLHTCAGPDEALARMVDIYETGLEMLREDFDAFAAGRLQGPARRVVYPYLCAEIAPEDLAVTTSMAFGKVTQAGLHGTTVTQPRLFADYLMEQMRLLAENHGATFHVGRSRVPIPLTFALDRATAEVTPDRRGALRHAFALPNLVDTNDDIADGRRPAATEAITPLSMFPAGRTDYSLHRLRHYTATAPEHFQHFVLFTNYQRYVDEFVTFGRQAVEAGEYEKLVEPGDRITWKGAEPDKAPIAKPPQMPAYHLVREGRTGITLVNIGVGPSNAKTVTDHLAVLRSHVWLMIGHCGGLRESQRLGDYVLAHAYLRDDHVLDQVLPTEIPLPTIAEVQVALAQGVEDVMGRRGRALKEHLRTGTVVTTDDRNWELRMDTLAQRFNQSRAIAIDMESATIAANGYRFRVPYGTLLCVSDRPLHGEIKLPGMADAFYERSVSQHLRIGIRALEMLRDEARATTLHSRKLRSFDEPAFR
ncbi:AMP nucleosidase [Caenispirillum salinarum AK4]|uniref:AMP nucleosidase n=1 Tax=Caenispirillum salinarum AK4 TaxID=1238182 RepID=K9HXG1_9PROT|nr:AMP nucleosidase [Caenispirillum salinarum]EKV32871.1 AMP nucleosidase [Caenispirillum salinarum AK4]